MTTQIIGGHNLGLLDGSYTVLNRNDRTGRGTLGNGLQAFANVSNGNLLFQERDIFLPSFGQDFNFVRTYNSRGVPNDAKGWWFSPNISLAKHEDMLASTGKNQTNYALTYGDGSVAEFAHNAARGIWISTDGAGAFETLKVLPSVQAGAPDKVRYLVTRADGSQYLFDDKFKLLSMTDANGVATTFEYNGDNVVRIFDDSGHVLLLTYAGGKLVRVTDELNIVLVQYGYTDNLLTQVTDRYGHITRYGYNKNNLLERITLPDVQTVMGVTTQYAQRTLTFGYEKVKWDDHSHQNTDFGNGDAWVVTSITDSNGGMTTFEYNFRFARDMASNDRDLVNKPYGGNDFQGGTTRVVDALGNARAYSNAAEFVAWRVSKGYYATYVSNYDPKKQAAQLAIQKAQAELIRREQAVTYTYDPNGQITKVTDELGFQTNYTYDFSGNLTSITDANGFGAANSDSAYYRALRAELGYSSLLSGLSAADKTALLARFTSNFTYDGNGNLLTSRDNAGNTTTYTYTAFNKVESITTALGHVTTFDYDAHQNLIRRTDGLGNITEFEYDANGNLVRRIVYLDKTDLVTAAKQQITVYSYDAWGNNTSIEDAEGHVTNQTFDHFGNLILSRDARGNQTAFVYDADNRLLSTTSSEGHTTSYAYDAVGNQIAVTDANGHTITRVFDKNNMLLSTIDPAVDAAKTRTTQYLYDVLGNGTRTTDAEGRVTTYAYDAHRQLVTVDTPTVKDADGNDVSYRQTFAYDGESNAVTTTDRRGNVTEYLFTVNGQIRRVTDANGNITEHTYDADLRRIEIVIGAQLAAAQQRKLTYTYDEEDQLLTVTDALGTSKEYSYDAPGNVVAVTDGNGQTTEFEFDRNNRLVLERRPTVDVNGTPTQYEVTHAWDGNGNEISTTDENGGITALAYDRDNRLVLVTANGINTVFRYDSRDNRTSLAIGVAATYDSDTGQVTITSTANGRVTTYTYDEFNQIVGKTDGVGNALVTSDDAAYRKMRLDMGKAELVAGLDDNAKASLLESFTEHYGYDRVGNRVLVRDHLDRDRLTEYDALDRVVAVTEGAGSLVRTTTYRYDGNDNLVKTTSPLGRVSTMTYDEMNQVTYTEDAAHVVTRNEYDQLGNLIAQTRAYNTPAARTTQYFYDIRGRMTEQRSPLVHTSAGSDASVVTKYAYDGEGNLTSRTSAFGLAEQRVEAFEYDANGRLIAQINGENERTEFEYDGVGNRTRITVAPTFAESRENSFEYDAGGRLTAEIDGEGVRTEYLYDANGNQIEVIQAAGIAGERHTLMTYDAEGRLLSVVDPIGWARAYSDAAEFKAWRLANSFAETAAAALAAGQTSAIQDSRRTRYEYDELGNQTRIIDAKGVVTENTFNEMGWLATNTVGVGGPNGGIRTTNTYDVFGNVLTSTQAWANGTGVSRTMTYQYDALDRQTRVTDGEDFSTLFDYDAFGNVTRIRRGVYLPSGAPEAAKTAAQHIYETLLDYDRMDRLLSTTDGRGNIVRNTYDALGNRLTQTTGLKTLTGLDVAHASVLTFKYDRAGRMTERETAAGGLVRLTYDEAGNLTMQQTLQSGAVGGSPVWTTRTFAYDGNGRTTDSYDSYSVRTQYVFDAVGNQTGIVYAKGSTDERSVGFEYDLANNRIADVDGYGNKTLYAYDAVGNRTKQTDARGNVTRFYYDAFRQLTGQLDARNFLTTYAHDAAGNVTETRIRMTAVVGPVTDASPLPSPGNAATDRVTTSVFDRANRVTQRTAPDSSYKVYQYDSTDKLVRQTQYGATNATQVNKTALATPRVLTWQYDDSGRVALFTNVDGVTETYTYDAGNNKLSETIHNPNLLPGGRTDPDRRTTFEYDLDNRLTRQLFDPTGLQLQQLLAYDKAGNVVAKTDSNGKVTASQYDLENRITRVTAPLSIVTNYAYDLIGNLVTVTNARGNALTIVYDLNNRVTQEIRAAVEVRHWVTGVNGPTLVTANVSPTTTTVYDTVGNAVQVTDARGNVTTRWYDETGNVIGELNGANALRRYTYDATGALLAATLYLTPRTSETFTLTAPPVITGDTRVATNEYDLGGRVTRTFYSAIAVTTVTYTGGNPTSTVETRAPEELNYYDAFGNLVESVDRNGRSNFAYYDLRGRAVATVDTAGYLIETEYDDQDNVVQQRRYKTRLTAGTYGAALRPAVPSGTPVTVDRIYDTAGRMTTQYSPLVRTSTGDVRVVNLFTYDGNGNMTSKTVASATISGGGSPVTNGNSRTEYYYYDDAGRRRAVVGADRVLNVFDYDANGNLTSQKRYFLAIGTGFTLEGALLANVLTSTAATSAKDQETTYAYDSADRMITRTDLMTGGNLIDESGYDENGNRTWGRNPDSYETSTRHDANGQIVEMVTPNGSHSHIEYDTGGLKVRAWISGPTGSAATAATIPLSGGARIANVAGAPLVVSWNQSGSGMTSWVAWGTTSQPVITQPPSPAPGVGGVYANATGPTVGTGNLSTAIALPAGQNTIYYRIVSQDSFGNVAWTPEQSVTVPARVESMSISQSGTDFVATIRFDAAVTSATLNRTVGASLALAGTSSDLGFTWTFTFTGQKSDRFQVEWVKGGVTYHTDNIALLEAPGVHADAGGGWVTWPIPRDSTAAVGNGQFILVNGVLQPPSASIRTITGQLNVQPPALANSTSSAYDVLYGTTSAQTHSAAISFSQRQYASYAFSSYNRDGDNNIVSTVYNINWAQDAVKTNVSATLLQDESDRVNAGGVKISYRTTQSGIGNWTDVAATKNGLTYGTALTLLANTTYDIKIWYVDTDGREVIVEWRQATTPSSATLPATTQMTVPGQDIAPSLPADINLTLGTSQSYTGNRSLTVLAKETGGQFSRDANGVLTVTAGAYVGPVDPGASNLLLNPVQTADSAGGAKSSNGLLALTYYTQIAYNALGIKIATNEDSGLWRLLGVDANGNVVQTSLYGTQKAQTDGLAAIDTFKEYDERGQEIASFGASIGGVRAITRTTYDYAGQVVKVVDPGNLDAQGRTFSYDDVGNRIASTDALGNGQSMAYNVFGQLVSTTDARGNIRRKDYDSIGRLIEEYVQGQVGNRRYYAYDAFGRRIQVARGGGAGLVTRAANGTVSGNVTALTADYDQRDRLVSLTDGQAGVTTYMYDGRDNLIWTKDANNNWFGTRYDGMGQVTHRYSFQTRWTDSSGAHVGTAPTTFVGVTAALNGSDAAFAATLRVETTTYDAFNNKISETDAAGRVRSFGYAEFGRIGSTTNGDLITTFTYNRFGNKTAEASSYGKNITYTYDNAGQLTLINDIGTNTSTTYTYDVAGRRATEVLQKAPVGSSQTTWHSYAYVYNANGWTLSWRDATTGIGAVYSYDAVGNVSSVKGLKTGSTVTNVNTGAVTAPLFTHSYTYDAFDRVITAVGDSYAHDDLSGTGDSYTYDARGRRATWVHDGTTTTYTYDNNDRVTNATNGTETVTWTYDAVGNVMTVGNGTKSTTYSYDTNNVSYKSVSDSTSTTFFDKSGRVLTTETSSGGSTYTYVHAYNGDGTEKSVSASGTGGVTGSSVSTYDVNGNLVHVSLGQGDDAGAIAAKDFYYDNQGHIVKATLDTTKEYLYANGNPVGEYADTANPTLNAGGYSVLRSVPGAYGNAAPDFPVAAVNEYVVTAGDTLQSIAGALYGHPELWYVIADANGLTGSERLPAGMRLIIPNTVQYAGFTSQTHALYNEGEIVGSKLPNLKSPPPPPKDNCAVIGAIIAIVVVTLVAVVATVLTAGALGPAAFAAVAGTYGAVAGVIAGVLVAAAVGAAIAFAASALTQVILVESGLQAEFDWKAVAADTAAGAFSGAAVGLGAIVGTVTKVTTILRVAAVIAQTALEVGGEITRQVILNGYVNDWTGVAIAGGTAALGSVGDLAETTKEANKAAAKVVKLEHGVETAIEASAKSSRFLDRASDALKSVGNAVANTVGGAGRRAEQAAVAGQRIADGFKQVRGVEGVLNALDAVNSAAKTAAKIEKAAKYTQRALIFANLAWSQLDKDRAAVVGRQSSFQVGSAGAAGRITGFARAGVAVFRAIGNTDQAINAPGRNAAGASNAASASRAAQSAFIDSPTVAAYALEHKRQNQWAPTSWVDAAASSITQIMSQFPGVPALGTTLHYNRLLAGETARFSSSSIAGFAAGTVGHVATNPVPLPIIVLNNQAPSLFG